MNELEQYLRKYQKVYKQIILLKSNLSNTDYQAIKHSEGEMTDEEYAPIKAKRIAWREEINKLETEMEKQ